MLFELHQHDAIKIIMPFTIKIFAHAKHHVCNFFLQSIIAFVNGFRRWVFTAILPRGFQRCLRKFRTLFSKLFKKCRLTDSFYYRFGLFFRLACARNRSAYCCAHSDTSYSCLSSDFSSYHDHAHALFKNRTFLASLIFT